MHQAEGSYLAAERALDRGLEDNPVGEDLASLVRAKADLLKLEGRFEDVRLLIRQYWDLLGRPLWIVRRHALLDLGPTPAEWLDRTLADAASKHPEDPRVELAQANLLIGNDKLVEAGVLLEASRRRMPDDHAVILGAPRPGDGEGGPSPGRRGDAKAFGGGGLEAPREAIRVWLARLEKESPGGVDSLRLELEKMCRVDPGDSTAVEELAGLDLEAGRPDSAAALRRRKSVIDEAKHKYRNMLLRSNEADLKKSAVELHDLAEKLGRRFEADGWRLIAGLNIDYEKTGREEPLDPFGTTAGSMTLATFAGAVDRAPIESNPRTSPRHPHRGIRALRIAPGRPVCGSSTTTAKRRCARLPETMSGGVGLFDYDNDGRLDVYFPQGGKFPPREDKPAPGDRLFRNRGDGTFEDVSRSSHISSLCAATDTESRRRITTTTATRTSSLTRFDAYQLLRNRGEGTFEDATPEAGLAGAMRYPSSAAWGDFDGDGDLDLYVCHYLEWDPGIRGSARRKAARTPTAIPKC